MRRPAWAAAAGIAAALAGSAHGEDFCPERPGQTTPPCVAPPGSVILETALAAWSPDTVQVAPSLVRVGVAARLEAQVGWAGLAIADGDARAGDLTLGVLYGLAPWAAVQAYVTAPVGQAPASAGDWSVGGRFPLTGPTLAGFSTAVTPEIDAEVNASGRGRHATYGGAVGIGHSLTSSLSASVDFAAFQHEEPQGAYATRTAGASLAWMATRRLQLDIGTVVGVDARSPSAQVYVGVASRF